ncbi:MAG TPA: ABC transporter permease [Saprospiraceae bacterium]|nr:ABC transporter permease [Saprospiraceae bacterium]
MFKTAIKFILYDKPKSLGALAGIIISIFLVGQQAGIFLFLTDAMKSLVANNNQYIWVVDSKTDNGNQLSALDMRVGRQIASLPGVERVHPVVIVAGAAKFENGKSSGLTLIGSEAPDFVGGPWNLFTAKRTDMLPEGAVVTEFFDSKTLGGLQPGDYFEINGQKVYNAGLTKGVRGFGAASYAFTTIERARSLSSFSKDKASLFLVKWKPGADKRQVINSINASISNIRAWDADEFAAATVTTVLRTNGIAASFGSLIAFAIVAGFIIIGLTLYSSAIDRIKDYGTLKAIGATNGYITRLILTQAFILAVVGFVIGRGMVEGFRQGIASAGTIFHFPMWLQYAFFFLTLFIALGGCLFAIRRINSLEPAQVFRG